MLLRQRAQSETDQDAIQDAIALTPLESYFNNLSTEEMQIFCELDFSPEEDNEKTLRDRQISIAEELARRFKEGHADNARDEHLSEKYSKLAKKLRNPASQEPEQTALEKVKNFFLKLRRTSVSHLFHVIYNEVRLFSSRVYKLFNSLGAFGSPKSSLGAFGTFLGTKLFPLAGLMYGVRLVTDLCIVGYTLLIKKPTKKEENLSFGVRLKNILTKDNRHHRMLNDIVWFPLNLLTYLLGGFILPVLGYIGGLTFDFINETVKAVRGGNKYDDFIDKTSDMINIIEKKPEEKTQASETINDQTPGKLNKTQTLKCLHLCRNKIKQKLVTGRWDRYRPVVGAFLIVAGVILASLPVIIATFATFPVSGVPLIIIGTALTLAGGSLISGLGYRIGKFLLDLTLEVGRLIIDKLKGKPTHKPKVVSSPALTGQVEANLQQVEADPQLNSPTGGQNNLIGPSPSSNNEAVATPPQHAVDFHLILPPSSPPIPIPGANSSLENSLPPLPKSEPSSHKGSDGQFLQGVAKSAPAVLGALPSDTSPNTSRSPNPSEVIGTFFNKNLNPPEPASNHLLALNPAPVVSVSPTSVQVG